MQYSFGNGPTPAHNPELGELFTEHDSGLTTAELDRIRAIGDELQSRPVRLYGPHDETHVKAQGADFPLNDETVWLYDRMAELAQRINAECYQYDLTGFHENFYYLRYQGGADHFDWHLDQGAETPAPRKLSLVLQLSHASEFDGGDFDVLRGSTGHRRARKLKGLVVAFPSYRIHRVTPVTKGRRRTLTMFAVGPHFR